MANFNLIANPHHQHISIYSLHYKSKENEIDEKKKNKTKNEWKNNISDILYMTYAVWCSPSSSSFNITNSIYKF